MLIEAVRDASAVPPVPTGSDAALGPSLLGLLLASVPPVLDPSGISAVPHGSTAVEPLLSFLAPPDPDPDPDPWAPPPVPPILVDPPRVQLLAVRAGARTPIAVFHTADVESTEESFDPGSADVTVSVMDPAWDLVGDFKDVEWQVGYAGGLEWSGVSGPPIDIGGDRVRLPLAGPGSVLDETTLGEVEQRDFLGGAGRFNAGISGWKIDEDSSDDFESTSILGCRWAPGEGWEGGGALQVIGVGYIFGPWVRLPGHPGRIRSPQGSVMAKVPSGTLTVETHVKVGEELYRYDVSQERAAVVEADRSWQGPVVSVGALPGGGGDARIGLYVESEEWCTVDFARIQWATLSGSTVPLDLALYPSIVMRDAQSDEFGGAQWGISVSVDSMTGAVDQLVWGHADDHPVGSIMQTLAERSDGPDIWIDRYWVMHVAARRGSTRLDVVLNNTTVLAPGWSEDVGATIDELRVLTDFGSGATRVVAGHGNGGRRGRKIRQIVRSEKGQALDAADRWGGGLFARQSLPQRTAEVLVPLDVGRSLNVGDTVQVALTSGRRGWSGWVRVFSIRKLYKQGLAAVSVGVDNS